MAHNDALKEAQRRWGRAGTAQKIGSVYYVGHFADGECIFFHGKSYQAAFADADRREKDNGNL